MPGKSRSSIARRGARCERGDSFGDLPEGRPRISERLGGVQNGLLQRDRSLKPSGLLEFAGDWAAAEHVFKTTAVGFGIRDELDLRVRPKQPNHLLGQTEDADFLGAAHIKDFAGGTRQSAKRQKSFDG